MMGSKERQFAPLCNQSIEDLVPADHFYRHLDAKLDLSFAATKVRANADIDSLVPRWYREATAHADGLFGADPEAEGAPSAAQATGTPAEGLSPPAAEARPTCLPAPLTPERREQLAAE